MLTLFEASGHLHGTFEKSPLMSHATCDARRRYLPGSLRCQWHRKHVFLQLCEASGTVHRGSPFSSIDQLLFVTPHADVCCTRQIYQSPISQLSNQVKIYVICLKSGSQEETEYHCQLRIVMPCKGSNFLRQNLWYSGTFRCGLISFRRLISLTEKKVTKLFVPSRGKPTKLQYVY